MTINQQYLVTYFLSRPLAPRWVSSLSWFRKSSSSCTARTMSSVYCRPRKKPDGLEWRWCLFWLNIQFKGSKYLHTSHFSSLGQLLGSKVLESADNARNAVNDTESAILSSSILEEFSFLLVRLLLDVGWQACIATFVLLLIFSMSCYAAIPGWLQFAAYAEP